MLLYSYKLDCMKFLSRVSVVLLVLLVAGSVLAQPNPAQSNPAQPNPTPNPSPNPSPSSPPQSEFYDHIHKAQAYLNEKRPDLAIPEFEAAAALQPDSVETQANLGVLLFFQGKPADAIPHLRAAVEKQPNLARIQGVLGIAEVRTDNLAQGGKDLEASFPLISDTRFKVQVGLELVSLYTQSGDLDQAVPVLAQLRNAAPDNAEVLYAAYRTYSDLSGEAMISLSLAAPDSAQMHQLLAHEEIKQGNTNAAIEQYRKAIDIDAHLPAVHYELAEVLLTSPDPAIKKMAEQEYRIAVANNPNDEKSICRLAEIADQAGNTQEAYQGYAHAVALQPADTNAKLELAKLLIQMDKDTEALALLEETVRMDPANSVAHYHLAILYKKAGRVEDAKHEVDLYKKYKDMKEKMRTVYKDLLIQPAEIRADVKDEN
jgi:predicted Zn-dependent protease